VLLTAKHRTGVVIMKYDVAIIGAGPGGIFSAYELTKLAPSLRVAVFEAGHSLEKRHGKEDGEERQVVKKF
jgi:uncharacterized protein